MSNSNPEHFRMLLREAGVPFYVIPLTLRQLGWTTWHTYVVNREYQYDDGSLDNLYIFPGKIGKYGDAVKLTHLLGKELALNNESVQVTTIGHIADAIEDGNEKVLRKLQAKVVVIDDFYEAGSAFPLSPRIAMRVKKWIYDRLENPSRSLVLCSSAPLSKIVDWWGDAFANRVRERLTLFEAK